MMDLPFIYMDRYFKIRSTSLFRRVCAAIVALLSVFILLETLPSYSAEEPVDVKTIIDRMDKLYRSDASYAEVEMTVVSKHWERTLDMDIWTESMEKTFIYINGPIKDEGIATLRIGTEMWNYFPKINKVMKVPPSMMMGSWMGSDFTNDDLVKESSLLKDYDHRLIHPENEVVDNYYVELIPKTDTPTVWGKIEITVRKADYIPVSEIYYDEKGRKMREMLFSDTKKFGNRKIPSVMEMRPLNKKGQKTVIRYKDITFDKPVGEDIFTLRNLQKRR
jgi:outer membrane lipoprotein-sorting protein